ncbi:glycosyltransferase [Microbacterium sp. CJ77]|uniref:glycosyltransferase n=1 Tax=Microbacterium sp. CJ77 TaxID=2079201 RepID=UPI0015E1A2B2|nr:glycosyltransferase [Microbacterium sp. CJ77]
MIHSPSLMAPLVRHDRTHDHDQTVVTLWSLEAWTHPQHLDRGHIARQRAMLRRAVRFADAVVVPTHAMAAELSEIAPLRSRVRVIAGAAPRGFAAPADALGRRRRWGLPEQYVVVLGSRIDAESLSSALHAQTGEEVHIAVVAEDANASRIDDLARAGEGTEGRIHAPVVADALDRAAILSGALAVVAPSVLPAFPWRVLEALAVGAPIIAAATSQNEELLADAACYVSVGDSEDMVDAIHSVVRDDATGRRLRLLSMDRSRSFSWLDASERVWQLHAEL